MSSYLKYALIFKSVILMCGDFDLKKHFAMYEDVFGCHSLEGDWSCDYNYKTGKDQGCS